jgi:peroxiredoxin
MSQIPEDSQAIRPLLVNATIPQLTLTDTDGQSFNVNAAVHEHPTILLFYRGGW